MEGGEDEIFDLSFSRFGFFLCAICWRRISSLWDTLFVMVLSFWRVNYGRHSCTILLLKVLHQTSQSYI